MGRCLPKPCSVSWRCCTPSRGRQPYRQRPIAPCTRSIVERFRYFINSQQPQDREDVKTELREIDTAIDKIAGVKTKYSGSIIRPFRPNRAWLWRRWTGTVLQHAYKGALWNMLITATISFFIGRRADCTWAVAMAPDKSNPIISRMAAFGQNWHYMMNLTTFILTFVSTK